MHDLTQLTEQQRHWLTHIEAAQQSSLSLAAYARSQELMPHNLNHWRSLLRQNGLLSPSSRRVSAFTQVQVTTAVTELAEATLRLNLSSGLSLDCSHWPEPAWLARLIHLLDQDLRA